MSRTPQNREFEGENLEEALGKAASALEVNEAELDYEILEQGRKDGWKLARHLTAICHDEDASRPVSAGFNYYPASVKNGLAAEVDIPGLTTNHSVTVRF